MTCNFHVGQRVVCVKLDKMFPDGVIALEDPIDPIIGKIYHVREILIGKIGGIPCIKLAEIPDQKIRFMFHGDLRLGDVVYDATGFRPVVERKTDISIFKAMLTKTDELV